jgi:hypothetical protein
MFVGLLNCQDTMVCPFFIRGFGVDMHPYDMCSELGFSRF